tara:strand:- start:707 stop:1024 length:318 start_codon:yes stop_codon:yes gene_type:complete
MTQDTPKQPKPASGSPRHTPSDNKERVYWLDQKKNVDKVFYGLCVLCGLSVAGDLLIHRHVILEIEAIFAFYGVYGFVACVGLVLAAKELRKFLKRKENYYDDDS